MQLELSRKLADLAFTLTRIIKSEFRADAGPGVPTLTQFRMLHAVKDGVDGVVALAGAFGISQPAASALVDAMVREGLLTRAPHRGDRRRVQLKITAKASARVDAIRRRAFARIDQRLASLPAARKKDLARRLGEVSRLLSAEAA